MFPPEPVLIALATEFASAPWNREGKRSKYAGAYYLGFMVAAPWDRGEKEANAMLDIRQRSWK